MKRKLLARLTAVETLERFLHKAYLGQKRFSIEGLDALVPILDQTVELAGASGARRVVLGMAHRGRLNVLARSEEHTSELQSQSNVVCRLLLEREKTIVVSVQCCEAGWRTR